MSDIILGTVQFGLDYGINNISGKPGQESIFEILDLSYKSGIHTLDTAEVYGDALQQIGSFHRKTGLVFNINTKFTSLTIPAIEAELESNLDKLGVGHVETYFYHTFSKYKTSPDLATGLKKMKDAQQIKKVGLSVYSNNEFKTAINDPDIDVIQLPFNLLDNYTQRGYYLKLAKEKQKYLQVRSVFLQGLFFKELTKLPDKLLPLKPYLQQLQDIARENSLSMESLCLQYANAQPYIDEIVIGVDTSQQLASNMTTLHQSLSPAICEKINSIQVKEVELLYPYNWM